MLGRSQLALPRTIKQDLKSGDCLHLTGESVRLARHHLYIYFLTFFVRSASLARIIIYSMMPDCAPSPSSTVPTPLFTPLPSGMNTPQLRNGSAGDYLSTPLMKAGHFKNQTYLAGSKALDSLAKMIASTESFFHPSNSGSWTADVCHISIPLKIFLAASIRFCEMSHRSWPADCVYIFCS
jgi:hypothetical protein